MVWRIKEKKRSIITSRMLKIKARITVTTKKTTTAIIPTPTAPSHPVPYKRLMRSSKTKTLRNNANSRYGINRKKAVDSTVPRREMMKALDRRVRFLPTTIKPAKYKTPAKTRKLTKKRAKENIKRNSSGITSHQDPLAATPDNIQIMI